MVNQININGKSKQAITINGSRIETNKSCMKIINDIITFSDGSFHNTITGEGCNKGPGYIKINGKILGDMIDDTDLPKVDNQIVETKLEPFNANKLIIDLLSSNMTVEPHEVNNMSISIVGTESASASVDVKLKNDTLLVSDMATEHISIIIKVPKYSYIKAVNANGFLDIKDIEGDLDAEVHGGGDINTGKIHNANLSIAGGGNIKVRHINGDARLNIVGNGDINVKDGDIANLTVNITGNGDADVNCAVKNAALNIVGNGDIYIRHVINPPQRNVIGFGEIIIDKIG